MALKELVDRLDKAGKLVRIKKPVSVRFEIPSIMRELGGRPVLFENVKESEYRVVSNIYSSRELLSVGLGIKQDEIIERIAHAIDNPKEPKVEVGKEFREVECDLNKLPVMHHYKEDGGPYIASGIVIANDKEYGLNASYHRMMVAGKDRLVLRILPRHFHEYIKRGNKEIAICIGVSAEVAISAAISCEINKSELSIANSMKGMRLYESDGRVFPESDIVLIAEVTGETQKEGPFLDLTETFDIVRKQPVIRVKKILVREGALFHALLPGGLEHKILMGTPREPTIFREVSKVCDCRDVYISPGGCSWLHGIVKIKKKHPDDGKKAIEAAFRGHKSMKHVFVVDEDIDITKPEEIEWSMATRFQGDKDLVVKSNEIGSSLDPSSDPGTRETCKVGFDLTIPGRDRESFMKPDLPMKIDIEDYIGD